MTFSTATTVVAAVLLTGFTVAQKPLERTPIDPPQGPAPARPTAEAPKRAPEPVAVSDADVVTLTNLGDQPDFAPTDEVLGPDGSVVALRRKGNPYVLSFASGDHVPEPGLDRALVRRLAVGDRPHTWGYVMIKGRMAREKMTVLQELGLTLLGRHTYQSMKARIPQQALPGLAKLPFVHWVGYARPRQKLDPKLLTALQGAPDDEEFEVFVQPFESDLGAKSKRLVVGEKDDRGIVVDLPTEEWVPNGVFQEALESKGFRFDWYVTQVHCFKGRATKAQILAIRDLDCIEGVELYVPAHAAHDQALPMVNQDSVRQYFPGVRAPIGVIDTGIDASPFHQDFSGKWFVRWNTTSEGHDDGNGHGTHVSGTVFGRGLADRRYMGAAPRVGTGGSTDRIYIGKFLRNSGTSQGNVGTLYNNFSKSFSSSPRPSAVNNSWGASSSSGFNGTETRSRTVDRTVWDHGQCYVFAAGNTNSTSGTWAASPGVAKNVLTVGSVDDTFSNTARPGEPSSFVRWYTTDGRIKPDVCAPGNLLTSCQHNTSTGYRNMRGTSMATPVVTGTLASLVDRTSFYQYRPHAMKALAMAGATIRGTMISNLHRGSTRKCGHGTVNSFKMNFRTAAYTHNLYTGTVKRSGDSYTVNLPIEKNLAAIKVMFTWIEPPASFLASKARVNDLRLFIDVPPYTGKRNTGDRALASSRENNMWYSETIGLANTLGRQMRGQTVQFKVYANSMGLFSNAKWALCVFRYFKLPSSLSSQAPSMTASVNRSYVRPGQTVDLTATLRAKSTADEFSTARVWFDGPANWAMTGLQRTTADNVVQSYLSSNLHPSSPFPRVLSGSSGGMVLGMGFSRPVKFTLRAPNINGWHTLNARATWHGFTTPGAGRSVCVDSQTPLPIAGLQSTTHKPGEWSNDRRFTIRWNPAVDVGCAGISGLAHRLGVGAPPLPILPTLPARQTSFSATLADTATGYFFRIRPVDRANNFPAFISIAGPFKIDTVDPSVGMVSIDNGATLTSSLIVSVKASGSDATSGVKEVRYSSDNSTWSAWMPYGAAHPYDLSSNGGNANPGKKTVFAQVRDHAGNMSASMSDDIDYVRKPDITGGTTTSLPNVTRSFYRLTGTDFANVTGVEFRSQALAKWSSRNDDWWANGAYRIVSDTEMHVYPPIGLLPGSYDVRFENAAGKSSPFPVKVVMTTTRTLHANANPTAGKPLTVAMALGPEPAASLGILVASPVQSPSVLPGVVSLEIGAGFTALIQLPALPFNGAGVVQPTFATDASFKGTKGYFEGVYLRSPLPLPTTNSWFVQFQ